MRKFFFRRLFLPWPALLWKIFDVANRCPKMICTGWRMTRESCIKVEFICKQRGRWQIAADAGEGTEGNGVVVCSNKTGPELLSTRNYGGHRKDWLLCVHCENCLCWENKSRVCARVFEYASLGRQFVSGNNWKESLLDYPNKVIRFTLYLIRFSIKRRFYVN